MGQGIQFWAFVELTGLVGVPVAAFAFRRLPGWGLGLARPISMLVATYPAWLLASLHMVPYGVPSALLGVALLLVASAATWRMGPLRVRDPNRSQALRLWLIAEGLFVVGFVAAALLRSYVPDVWQTEKPMDMAFINSINRSAWFPPHDPWLSGVAINYYYYGHYIVAWLIRMTGVEPSQGFNLGLALFFGMSTSAVFTVAAALSRAIQRHGPASQRAPILAGLAAVAFALLLGNLAGGLQFLQTPSLMGSFDWWSPSRVIPNTINEFPFFSFLLGDLHPHLMAVPIAMATLAYALQLAVAGPSLAAKGVLMTRGPDIVRRLVPHIAELLIAALLVGSLYAINGLDYPTEVGLVLLALTLWVTGRAARDRWPGVLAWATSWLGASVIFFLPFWLHFAPPSGGIGLVVSHAPLRQFLLDYVLIYGLFLWIVGRVFIERIRQFGVPGRYLVWNGVAALVLLVLIATLRLDGVLLLAATVLFALQAALATKPPDSIRFFWLLVAAGIALTAVGEVVYIRDVFDGTPFYRMNTVFKFGFQGWLMLAVASGVASVWGQPWLRTPTRRLRQGILVGLVALAAIYPVLGTYSREARFAGPPTLYGMRWLAPGDVAAIKWIQSNVGGAPTLLEEIGPDYDPAGRGRVSTYTGLPTVLAWSGHEIQWGHDSRLRGQAIHTIYGTLDPQEARSLLIQYGIRYVIVGSLERADYSAASLAKFSQLGALVFSESGAQLYQVG
jgi:YYY domain-containing protein